MSKTDERIVEHRMAPIRIIVVGGDGKPASGVKVHIEQLRHDFTLGFAVSEGGLAGVAWDEPVWRCFNAVALDRLSAWPVVQPEAERWEWERVEAVVDEAMGRGMMMRWGGVVSADAGRIPPWAAELEGDALRRAADAHLAGVLDRFGLRVGQFDVYTHDLDHDLLGEATVRRLYEEGKAAAPRAAMCVRLEDALTEARGQDMIARIMEMKQAMIPFDAISLEQRIGGILLQAPLARLFDVVGGLDVEVVIGSLEVGGASEAAAAVNVETFLRTAFADPNVSGIYFAGLTADELMDPNAALISGFGFPTEAGEMVDDLFHKLWWTDASFTADELGNVRTRVFAGTHRMTATLADGTAVESTVYIPPPAPQREPRVILLEPVK